MATATGNYVMDNSTLAHFQSWSSAIYNAFIAFGWLQTADAGQAANPVAAVPSSAYAYWIFKANDAAAATMPIYVKVEVGYSSTIPSIKMTVGTSSDGSGSITGQKCTSTPWQITQSGSSVMETNQGGTLYPCFFSGDAGEFRMYMWQSTTQICGTLFAIERSKDTSGVNTDEYFTALCSANAVSGYAAVRYQQTVLVGGIGNLETGILGLAITNNSNTGAALGTTAAFPVFPVLGKVGNPMLGIMAVCSGDTADAATVTVLNMYAGTHTAIVVKGSTSSGGFGLSFGQRLLNGGGMAGLMRYE